MSQCPGETQCGPKPGPKLLIPDHKEVSPEIENKHLKTYQFDRVILCLLTLATKIWDLYVVHLFLISFF